MNCEEYREGLMDAARGREGCGALEHTRGCPACAQVLRDQRALGASLAAFANNETLEPSAELENWLLAHFDPSPRRWIAASRWAVLAFTGAAAAVAALIFLVRAPTPAVKTPRVVAEAPMPPRKAEPPIAAPVRSVPRQKPTHRARPVESAPEAELPFMPVPYAAPLLSTERIEVVRVNLPANALASLGLPVLGAKPEMRLNADLVLGENGLARAVRLVRTSSTQ